MIRTLQIALLVTFSNVCFSFDLKEEKALAEKYCSRSAVEVEISKDIFSVSWSSDVLVKLLSGNSQGAAEQLGFQLGLNILVLSQQIEKNPCLASKELLDRIYPILRVVSAVNEKTPIPNLNRAGNITKIFKDAIQADPKHYDELLERSKEWSNGIK